LPVKTAKMFLGHFYRGKQADPLNDKTNSYHNM
jgi:hypothetical protein